MATAVIHFNCQEISAEMVNISLCDGVCIAERYSKMIPGNILHLRGSRPGLTIPLPEIHGIGAFGCSIPQADFHNITLIDCVFMDCDLTEADFSGTQLRNVGFSRCNLRGMKLLPLSASHVIAYDCNHQEAIINGHWDQGKSPEEIFLIVNR